MTALDFIVVAIFAPAAAGVTALTLLLRKLTAEPLEHIMDEWHTAVAQVALERRRVDFVFDSEQHRQVATMAAACERMTAHPPRRGWLSGYVSDDNLLALETAVNELHRELDSHSVAA